MTPELACFTEQTVDSTSSWAWRYWVEQRANLELGPTVFVADSQTHGRGAGQGRSWQSSLGTGLFMSLLLTAVPTGWIATQTLPKLAGLCCHQVLRSRWPDLPVVLKGINDLFLQLPLQEGASLDPVLGKLGGILVETRWRPRLDVHAAVIGIGINLTPFGEQIPAAYPIATLAEGLGEATVATLDRLVLARELSEALLSTINLSTPDDVLAQWLVCKRSAP